MADEVIDWKVGLVFTKQQCAMYAQLSKNIIREVCCYFQSLLLPAVLFQGSLIDVHDMLSGNRRQLTCKRTLEGAIGYCLIASTRILVAGGDMHPRDAFSVDLRSGACTDEDSMQDGRRWPGIVRFSRFVYLFGGNTDNMLKSCEKWNIDSKTWTRCADMMTPKVCFTPCVLDSEIYLAETDSKAKQLEVYSPATDQYRLLPLVLSSALYGSVSFILDGELFLFNYDQKAYSWRLDSDTSNPENLSIAINRGGSVYTNCPLTYFGSYIYWPGVDGRIVKFDVKRRVILEPK